MRILERRILLAAGASWLALDANAIAQNAPAALPDVNVTAPSPIVRRKPAAVAWASLGLDETVVADVILEARLQAMEVLAIISPAASVVY
mgnify:CR=1 FL=1